MLFTVVTVVNLLVNLKQPSNQKNGKIMYSQNLPKKYKVTDSILSIEENKFDRTLRIVKIKDNCNKSGVTSQQICDKF